MSITSFGLLMASGRQLTAEIAFTSLCMDEVARFLTFSAVQRDAIPSADDADDNHEYCECESLD